MAQQRALVIIDIQNDYFEGGAFPLFGSQEASLKAKILLEQFRKEGLPIIHIQHIATRTDAGFFLPNTNGVEIHPNVKPEHQEQIIVKNYPNSFRGTNLYEILEKLNVKDLIICGMMTSMCVDATTRAAKDLGYNCTVIADACASPNLEINNKMISADNVQNAFLAALSYFYATVISADDYILSRQ